MGARDVELRAIRRLTMARTCTKSGFRPTHLCSNRVVASTTSFRAAATSNPAHLQLSGVRPTAKAGAAPHLYIHIEGTQSPALDPLAAPEPLPRRPQRRSPTVADRS